MLFTKVFYEDKELQAERLELTDKGSLYFLGSNLTLRDCALVLKVPARNVFIDGVRFINCTIEVKQELKNHAQWLHAFLQGCRFKGRFSGCDFGNWPASGGYGAHGSIEDCDFTEARLDGCRFMGCDPATLRLPGWPHFTVLDPVHRAPELRRLPWPGRLGHITVDVFNQQPPGTAALTFFAPKIAREDECTEEELRAHLAHFDFIRV